MTDGDQLLRAILTDPTDLTVRLAYADWLDENGGDAEHAEHIRLSIELAAETLQRRLHLGKKLNSRWKKQLGVKGVHFDAFDGFFYAVRRSFECGDQWQSPLLLKVFSFHPIEHIRTYTHTTTLVESRKDDGMQLDRTSPRIPSELFVALNGVGGVYHRGCWQFTSQVETRRALSRVWVNHIRSKLSLPPLVAVRDAIRMQTVRNTRGRIHFLRRHAQPPVTGTGG